MLVDQVLLKMAPAPIVDLRAIATAKTACVSVTANFKSAVGPVNALAVNLYSTFFKMSLYS